MLARFQPNKQLITQYLFQSIDDLRRLCDHVFGQLVQFFAADRIEFIVALFYFRAELFILYRLANACQSTFRRSGGIPGGANIGLPISSAPSSTVASRRPDSAVLYWSMSSKMVGVCRSLGSRLPPL